MRRIVDYYFNPQSPWTYLGHERFTRMARETGATVNVIPVDFRKVFPVSGGLQLHQRAPQRQAYRLVDLARHSKFLKIPMNLQPKFFPVVGDKASRVIIAVDREDGTDAAVRLCAAIFAAVWTQERDIADLGVLRELLLENGFSASRMDAAASEGVGQQYEANTEQAIARNVFGAPSYVIDSEVFWGQDRLEFVERALKA